MIENNKMCKRLSQKRAGVKYMLLSHNMSGSQVKDKSCQKSFYTADNSKVHTFKQGGIMQYKRVLKMNRKKPTGI